MKKFNIGCKFVKGQNPQDLKAAIDDKTRAIYIETIGNPQFNVPDLEAICKVAHEAGIVVICDNTFGMGGYLCKPIDFGVRTMELHVEGLWTDNHHF